MLFVNAITVLQYCSYCETVFNRSVMKQLLFMYTADTKVKKPMTGLDMMTEYLELTK